MTPAGRVFSIYAGLLLLASVAAPWWQLECRAPQYGTRVLRIEVLPSSVRGDTKEMDLLGHYVGIRSVESFAPVEKRLASFGLIAAALLAFALPYLPAGRVRNAALAVLAAVPAGFCLDLWFWQHYSMTHLDPNVALNMIQNRIQTRLVGAYQVAQFRAEATFQEGFWFALIAAMNGLGFWIAERKKSFLSVAKGSVVAASVLFASFPSSRASAEVLEVGPGKAHATLGKAIAVAEPGDEIRVGPGRYRENVVVDRPLKIVGEEGVVIDGGGRGTVLTVTQGPSEIRGLAVRNSGDSLLGEDAGVRIAGAPDVTVKDCRAEDVLFGLLAVASPRARLVGNRVIGKDLPPPRRGDGIRIYAADDSLIEGNLVERSRDLAIWQSHRATVAGNVVRTSRYGLHYMYCDDNVFENNVFEDNQVGAAVMYSRRLTLKGNRFARSRGVGAVGLLIKAADDVRVEDNRIVDNERGIFLENTPQTPNGTCEIRGNVVAGNDAGVTVLPSVRRAVFVGNDFVANGVQVRAEGNADTAGNVWSENGRGNYWSDYVGFDADHDGVGDAPHRVEQFFQNLAERWPEAGLLRLGPAASALEMAARAFPIGRQRLAAEDGHPLMAPRARPEGVRGSRPRPAVMAAGVLAATGSLGIFKRAFRRAA